MAINNLQTLLNGVWVSCESGTPFEAFSEAWQGPNRGPQGGTYWVSRATGEHKYQDDDPGGTGSNQTQKSNQSQSLFPSTNTKEAEDKLKALGKKNAQIAREKWGDQAHAKLNEIANRLVKEDTPESHRKALAAEYTMSALAGRFDKVEKPKVSKGQDGVATFQYRTATKGEPIPGPTQEGIVKALADAEKLRKLTNPDDGEKSDTTKNTAEAKYKLAKMPAFKGDDSKVAVPFTLDGNEPYPIGQGYSWPKKQIEAGNFKTQRIPLKGLRSPQDDVTREGVLKHLENPTGGRVTVVKHGDEYHLADGNHRAMAAWLRGETEIEADVIPSPKESGKATKFSELWQGPNHGDRQGTFWVNRKTGEKKYQADDPGGAGGTAEQQTVSGKPAGATDHAQKYAQIAKEKWGDQAHQKLSEMVKRLTDDQTPEGQRKLAAAKATLAAVHPEPKQEHPPTEPAKKPEGKPAEQPAAKSEPLPTPGEPILKPQDQVKVNETKRANMDPEQYKSEKTKQYANTERAKAEVEREQNDKEDEEGRKKEDEEHAAKKEAMEKRHGDEMDAAENKVATVQQRREEAEAEREEEDAAEEDRRQKEDDDFEAKTAADDEKLQKDREAEDDATEAARKAIRQQLTDGTLEDARTLDAAEAKWEKEDEKRDENRGKYDDKAAAEYEKADTKRNADREKQDAKIRKAREAEDKKLDKAEAKVENERDALEETHQNEIDDLDQEETDREAAREEEDSALRDARDEEDEYFDEEEGKEDERATELIDSFEGDDDTDPDPPDVQLDAVRAYNEKAAKNGERNRIIWYEGTAFQGWANENIDKISPDDFDRFCPSPKSDGEKFAEIDITTARSRDLRHGKGRSKKKSKKRKSKRSGASETAMHQAAKTLGTKGGLKGGPARARALSAHRRSEIAREGGKARQREKD